MNKHRSSTTAGAPGLPPRGAKTLSHSSPGALAMGRNQQVGKIGLPDSAAGYEFATFEPKHNPPATPSDTPRTGRRDIKRDIEAAFPATPSYSQKNFDPNTASSTSTTLHRPARAGAGNYSISTRSPKPSDFNHHEPATRGLDLGLGHINPNMSFEDFGIGQYFDNVVVPNYNFNILNDGTLADRVPLWTPPKPQEPIVLANGAVFNVACCATSISSQIRQSLCNRGNPEYAHLDAGGLTQQQLQERHSVLAVYWQTFCADELVKLGVEGMFVISRKFLLRIRHNDVQLENNARWDGTWKPSAGSPFGWGFVNDRGDAVDTHNLELVDLHAFFEQHLATFQGDYERMIRDGHRALQAPVDGGIQAIDPSLLTKRDPSLAGSTCSHPEGSISSEGSLYQD